jgi:hypothetical protein
MAPRLCACGRGGRPLAAAATAALAMGGLAPGAGASARADARRCVARSVPVAVGARVLVVKRAAGSRTELWVCRRGSGRPLRLGATFGDSTSTRGGARSALIAAAVGGTVAAAAFKAGANGCLYEYGCADAPHRVLRIADAASRVVRRLPLAGPPTALAVAADGSVTFRVDELVCVSTYRTTAVAGAPVELLSRVAARAGGAACSLRPRG